MDAKGTVVSLDAKSAALPLTAMLATPSRTRELLSGVAFEAAVVAPTRELATYPPAIALEGVGGALAAELALRGTLAAPEVDLKATLSQARASAARVSFPVDFDLSGHYAAGKAKAHLAASARHGQVLDADLHAEGALVDVIARPASAPWQASGKVHLEAFPLGGLGFLEDRQVRGHLTGDVAIDDLHSHGHATVDLGVGDLQIGEVAYKDARVHAELGGDGFDATVHLDHGDGSADARALAGASWGSALVPSFDPPVSLSLSAKAFRAETFLPFAHETLAELEGRIDGRAHVAYDPRANKTELEGKIALSHGKIEMSSALGELHDAKATLVLTADGVLRLEDAEASGVTGRLQAAASARLSVGKDGLALEGARARVEVPKKTPLPITVEGTPLGTIDGTVEVRESPTEDRKGMAVAVEVPTLHVQLPSSGSRSLQPLGELEDADVGVRPHGPGGGSARLVLVPLGPPLKVTTRAESARRIEITAHLADVEIKRGVDLKVDLEGQPVVTVTDKVRVTGQLRLKKGGKLDVQGKAFEIESGTITFVGDDPENPQVVVLASWNASDANGTKIYANYVGPLKTGKVTLRAEPALSQADIVSLLQFGTVESASGAGGQSATNSTTGTAVGAAGGVATQPINHALDQFGVHAVAARVDTSQAANPKPEVELQIAKDISVQLAVVIGTPPPGSNPDTTLLTLNWRLLHGLTVATTVGNSGSSFVDMVWERRY
jgi:translocation and assembly module TamB